MNDAARLLETFARHRDAGAFDAWARLHLDLVHSAAATTMPARRR